MDDVLDLLRNFPAIDPYKTVIAVDPIPEGYCLVPHSVRNEAADEIERLRALADEMRHAIDMIEGAMMGLGDFVELPRVFDGCADTNIIAPKLELGAVRRTCTALEECTRIINSPDHIIQQSGHTK